MNLRNQAFGTPARSSTPFRAAAMAAALTVLVAACATEVATASPAPVTSPTPALTAASSASIAPASATPAAPVTLSVWSDDVRAAGFKKYAAAHPNVTLNVQVINDSGEFLTKILLAKKSGTGLPDLVFDGAPDHIAKMIDPSVGYAADLTSFVPADTVAKFSNGSLAQCQVDGHLYCLRNDLAQVVLWYDKTLMDQFGYTVPTTWQQWKEIGLKVAKEHPGYIVGSFGDFYSLDNYFWSFGCPVNQLTGANSVRIALDAPECSQMTDTLDPLLAAGSLSREDAFGTTMTKLGGAGKILMMPAASWFGEYMFKQTYLVPKGRIAAAAPLSWNGDPAATGAQGGGIYYVSSTTKNLATAADVVTWMATDINWQASSVTYPAFGPAAEAWHERTLKGDAFYAADPFPALQAAAGEIRPTWGYVRYPVTDAFTATVLPAVQGGGSIAGALPAFGKQLAQMAGTEGYTVTK